MMSCFLVLYNTVMREIKFRAWDKKRKLSREVASLELPVQSESENIVLMQYTGMRDRSGKDIYEGDILALGNEALKYYQNWVVEYNEAEGKFEASNQISSVRDFTFSDKDGITDSYLYVHVTDEKVYQVEVIGNIYEDPELLNVTSSP